MAIKHMTKYCTFIYERGEIKQKSSKCMTFKIF